MKDKKSRKDPPASSSTSSKKGGSGKDAPSNAGSKQKGDNAQPGQDQQPTGPKGKGRQQRPPMNPEARRAVTNSVSWTGKLPATLLFEYCQKQKWEKVQFDMVSYFHLSHAHYSNIFLEIK